MIIFGNLDKAGEAYALLVVFNQFHHVVVIVMRIRLMCVNKRFCELQVLISRRCATTSSRDAIFVVVDRENVHVSATADEFLTL